MVSPPTLTAALALIATLGAARTARAQETQLAPVELAPVELAPDAPDAPDAATVAALAITSPGGRQYIEINPRPPGAPRSCPTPCLYQLPPGVYGVRPAGGVFSSTPWTHVSVTPPGVSMELRAGPVRRRSILAWSINFPGPFAVLSAAFLSTYAAFSGGNPYLLWGVVAFDSAIIAAEIVSLVLATRSYHEPAFELPRPLAGRASPWRGLRVGVGLAPVDGGAMAAIVLW